MQEGKSRLLVNPFPRLTLLKSQPTHNRVRTTLWLCEDLCFFVIELRIENRGKRAKQKPVFDSHTNRPFLAPFIVRFLPKQTHTPTFLESFLFLLLGGVLSLCSNSTIKKTHNIILKSAPDRDALSQPLAGGDDTHRDDNRISFFLFPRLLPRTHL